ncbi:MAG: hypothetical protein PS018_03535 [bacterium]|nr:hypothetical protein [bacterium]
MPHRLDQGRERFRRLVSATNPALPKLPLVHSTDAYAIGNILDDAGKITPQLCSVFEPERLTYLFYGRAAYRPNLAEEPTNLDHFLPVCLIFKVDASIKIKRVFPFDSGAFHHGFYKAYLHKNMRLGDFLLEADAESPGRIVRRFFTDNTNYIVGQKAVSDAYDPSQFEAKSYEMLIGAQGANAMDSRGGGVEIQTDQPIDMLKDVEAAVIPSSQARAQIGKRLADAGIEVIPYRTLGRLRPNEFTGGIYDKCLDYLCRKKLVDESRL